MRHNTDDLEKLLEQDIKSKAHDLEIIRAYREIEARYANNGIGNTHPSTVDVPPKTAPGINTGLGSMIEGYLKTVKGGGSRLSEILDYLVSKQYPHKSRQNLSSSANQALKRLVDKTKTVKKADGRYYYLGS